MYIKFTSCVQEHYTICACTFTSCVQEHYIVCTCSLHHVYMDITCLHIFFTRYMHVHVSFLPSFLPSPPHRSFLPPLTRKVVNIASIQEEVAVHRVTQRWHVAREGHAGSHIAPEGARVMHTHLGVCYVSGHTEVGDPEILCVCVCVCVCVCTSLFNNRACIHLPVSTPSMEKHSIVTQ